MASDRVTIRDVARVAGVSATTVSHALNGKGRIEQATRERVLEAVRQIGYIPNPIARSLRSGKTATVGLVLPPFAAGEIAELMASSWYPVLAQGAAQSAFRNEHALLMIPTIDETRGVNGYAIDGLVISDPLPDDPRLAVLADSPIPIVTVDVDPHRRAIPHVRADVTTGMRSLLEHVHGTGARTVAALAPDLGLSVIVDELSEYEQWCAATGNPFIVHRVPVSQARNVEDLHAMVRERAKELLRPNGVDGVAQVDGVIAMFEDWGALVAEAAESHGLRVPGDVVIAQDVDQPANTGLGITALDQHPGHLGAEAVDLLCALLRGEQESERLVPVTLNRRQSTAR